MGSSKFIKPKRRKMQQVARTITVEEALGAFVKLARNTRMTGDEHDQFILFTRVLKAEIDEGVAAKQELEKLKEEHGKCPKQPNGTPVDSGQVGSQADGSVVGEGGSAVASHEPASELIQ